MYNNSPNFQLTLSYNVWFLRPFRCNYRGKKSMRVILKRKEKREREEKKVGHLGQDFFRNLDALRD